MPLHPQEPPACIELLIYGVAGRYFVTDQLRATDALRRMADPGEDMVDFDGGASRPTDSGAVGRSEVRPPRRCALRPPHPHFDASLTSSRRLAGKMRRRCRRNFVLTCEKDGPDPSINWESEVAKLEAHEGAILTRCHQPLSHRPQGLGAASSPADRATGRIPAPAYPATTVNRPSSPHTAPVPLAAPSGTQPTAGERFASYALRACSMTARSGRSGLA